MVSMHMSSCRSIVDRPADHDGLLPARDQPGDVLHNNGFSEHCAVEDVSDGAIGGDPHLLEAKLLDSALIRSDGCTLDANSVLL